MVLVHYNITNNDYRQDSRVLYTFAPSKSFDQLLEILPTKFMFLNTFSSELSYTDVWFTDQNNKPPEM